MKSVNTKQLTISVPYRVSVFLLLFGSEPLKCQQVTDSGKVSDNFVFAD